MKDYKETYELNECGLEILSETQLEDTEPETPDMDGYSLMIHIINVRLNRAAINAYHGAKCKNDRMELWEKKMQELAGITVRAEEGFSITQNVSEFFTIVYMENLKEYGRKAEETDTAGEDKAGLIRVLGETLRCYAGRTNVAKAEYVQAEHNEEFAVITFVNGSQKRVRITGDSCPAIVQDIYRKIV